MRVRKGIAVLFSILLIGFYLSCSGESNQNCQSDRDCSEGNVCCKEKGSSEGTCKPKDQCQSNGNCDLSCKTQADCFNYQVCKDGCCQDRPIKKCTKDLDCPEGEECSESPDGKICQICSYPCKLITDCPKNYVCERKCCRKPPCSKNDDCKDEQLKKVCDKQSGKCVECLTDQDCQANNPKSICKNNRCAKVECVKDGDCPASKPLCNKKTYTCQKKRVCTTDSDCNDPKGIFTRCDPNANGGLGACKKGHCVSCSTDDECGGSGDFCVGTDKGLKDGPRCLRACESDSDCPNEFICSPAIVPGKKICFPTVKFCEDPCKEKQCPNGYRCEGGLCKPNQPCLPCDEDRDCAPGSLCLDYQMPDKTIKKFCGQKCQKTDDCPKDPKRNYQCVGGQCVDTNKCQ